jgi:hypothetical protein
VFLRSEIDARDFMNSELFRAARSRINDSDSHAERVLHVLIIAVHRRIGGRYRFPPSRQFRHGGACTPDGELAGVRCTTPPKAPKVKSNK